LNNLNLTKPVEEMPQNDGGDVAIPIVRQKRIGIVKNLHAIAIAHVTAMYAGLPINGPSTTVGVMVSSYIEL
jgi:hypothetical protein